MEPCPRCACLPGAPDPLRFEGSPCTGCGRMLPLPAGLPAGTVMTQLLALKLLSQSLPDVWATARELIEDERLRTKLLAPIDPSIPDAFVSMNRAEVPDPVTPAVLAVIREERAEHNTIMRRLLYALRMRRALLPVILRETWGAGFQRDEARVAARLGFPLPMVRLAVSGKKLVRQ